MLTELAKAIITFYNRYSPLTVSHAKPNREVILDVVDRTGGDLTLIQDHITNWVAKNSPNEGEDAVDYFKRCFAAIEIPVEETPVQTPGKPEDVTVANSIACIGNAVTEFIKSTSIVKIEGDILGGVEAKIDKYLADTYGPIERKVIVDMGATKREVKGILHEKFDEVLQEVSNNIPVYLVGPAGSGKNVLCKQVAEALGLKFYFTNAVTQEYKLTGFTDAMGKYQPTQFYKAFTEGGLFMLDEIDASIPEVLTILNAAIANKYFDFPAPIGYKEAHPDFRVIAAGNTAGNGADYQYVGRNQLDGASTNRFVYETVDYSPIIEDGLALDKALADFCREFRAAAKRVGVNIIVSYRAIEYLTRLLPIMPMEKALRACLVKDLEKDDLNLIIRELSRTPYKSALETIYNGM